MAEKQQLWFPGITENNFLCHIPLDFRKLRLNILKGTFCLSGSEKFHQQLGYLVSSSLIYKENHR